MHNNNISNISILYSSGKSTFTLCRKVCVQCPVLGVVGRCTHVHVLCVESLILYRISLISFYPSLLYLLIVTAPSNGNLRLVNYDGHTGSAYGRLEFYYGGQWGTVCNDFFGSTEANVACQQLGYPVANNHGTVGRLG